MSICNPIPWALLALAVLNVYSPRSYWPWKLSVPSRELGHILALLPLILVLAPSTAWNTRGIAALAVALFLRPVVQAFLNERRWARELEENLKAGAVPPLLDLPTLYIGNAEKSVAYQEMSYAPGLSLDFYPAQIGQRSAPLVVVVHGGGWDSGDSRQMPELNSYLANRGFHVVSINYRLAPEHRWPAQLQDLTAAIAFMKGKASELKIDADRIAVLGRSAGAQIAGVYAYSKDDPSVRAFIDFYGPTDLTFGYEVAEEVDIINSRLLIRQLHGGDPYGPKDLYVSSSILLKLDERPVPTLVLHGYPDNLSWYKHGERLCARLRSRGHTCAQIMLPWGAHGFDWSPRGPGGQVAFRSIHYFLSAVLG